ncbi:aldose epimerase family protein [Azospirillum sp. SYSU D00513]|uniref:aldose epimerase family protein n=1 Tax=Azospirillum sp. SYSU D00513 TaxID=2812561 RepID=UPI001A96965F|nr:aldose epimerase family protein [Azospirillum sp. SYSU D00513]
MTIEAFFLPMPDGTVVPGFVLTNGRGMRAKLTAFGARLLEMWVPDRDGRAADVVLGFDTLPDYLASDAYFGGTCGRYANRVAGGRFTLDGTVHQLTRNEGENQLHGGPQGFDRRVWTAVPLPHRNAVTFSLLSPDGEEGYPGTLTASVTYGLAEDALHIRMTAMAEEATVVNLAHHSYWNLAGQGSGDIRSHRLGVLGGHWLPVDEALIPTGELRPVGGTPFDLRQGRAIGEAIGEVGGIGFDHNWCLDGEAGEDGLHLAAWLEDPASGRRLDLFTNQPGLQVYTGAYLTDRVVGKGGRRYCREGGIALETQRYPDAPNRWPAMARLDPAEVYEHRQLLRFSTV